MANSVELPEDEQAWKVWESRFEGGGVSLVDEGEVTVFVELPDAGHDLTLEQARELHRALGKLLAVVDASAALRAAEASA